MRDSAPFAARDLVLLNDEQVVRIRSEISREVDHATNAAEQAPYPDASTFDRHVYADR